MTQGDVFIRYIAFPQTIKGVTVPNDDGTFSIYINAVLPEAQQRQALRHELTHIQQNHFYDEAPVLENESDAISPLNRNGPIPYEALVFARRGHLNKSTQKELLKTLDATVDQVLTRLRARMPD